MFSSRRKSRDPAASIQSGFGNGVNSNALAAASAIGNALKTGTPIPRSNSLQKSSSFQRSSSLVGGRPVSRSGSLLGLQGPPSQFQQQNHGNPPSRTQSLTSGSVYNQKLKQKRSSQVPQQSGPRMIKKHIPGPYGLITVEVPAEEEKPKGKPKRPSSLTKNYSDRGSLRSYQSNNSLYTNSQNKRAIINEPLREADEEIGDDFEQNVPLHPSSSHDTYGNARFDSTPQAQPFEQQVQQQQEQQPQNLTFIQEEEEVQPETLVADDLSNLKLEKEQDESKIEKDLNSEQSAAQNLLSAKLEPETEVRSSPAPSEIRDIKETITTTEPELQTFEQSGDEPHHFIAVPVDTPTENSDIENEVLDQYTDVDPPSTAKSTDTITPAQSSYTTADDSDFDIQTEKDPHQDPNVHSMAQQLRPTIPSLTVNGNQEQDSSEFPAANGLSQSNSVDTAGSSLYSNELNDEGVLNSDISGTPGNDLQIPARSTKRSPNSISPRKSALKSKSGSTINLQDNNNSSSPANAAYLSLTTAENTRLNAISSSNLPATNLTRSNSSRQSLKQEPPSGNGFKGTLRSHPPQQQNQQQFNGQRHSQFPQPPQQRQPFNQQRPQQKGSIPGHAQKRPNSVAVPQSNTSTNKQFGRPQAPVQGQRPQSQVIGSQKSFRNSQIAHQNQQNQGPSQQKLHSNAAALNAAMKKAEPPKPPQLNRTSSFEKERPQERNAAFKKRSLRDPSINQHANVESQLGFYRQQAAQQQQHTPTKTQPTHAQTPPQHHQSNGNGNGFSGFKSRFNDSDDDDDIVPTLRNPKQGKSNKLSHDFAPPPNNPTLRNTKSQFTLRSSSNSAVQGNPSPAKSLPEKRNTRYFSEADKEELFNEHLKKAEANLEKEKKKSKFGGKLKKLFGRS
ncbi:hypothetical protein BN7_345 [Wickerhamomyces ciferrii]|uniref:Eisosome protein SEG1 n=1 Tax=Wickerhamomyces ciferrii (strain ATCC 14091 / BCRC 22168 / CBS 111 / JCM 3599 / NBRC 0793 / NRRL Y-1031 F-60-10) TaxID=1206466 RepID=K0KD51_WICCF|nr:uncharacterized protein BN7_345 [Wickerhamomyces ciferrii]CCH40811.1 hypothetical protein BN7_345 [Wickerhamomyces ciferrii]